MDREKIREDIFREKYKLPKKIKCPHCWATNTMRPEDEFQRVKMLCWNCEEEFEVDYGEVVE